MKPPLKNATILITGASSGMGKELTRKLSREAKTLILVARREDKLKSLALELKSSFPNLAVHVMPCNLADLNALKTLTNRVARVSLIVVFIVVSS